MAPHHESVPNSKLSITPSGMRGFPSPLVSLMSSKYRTVSGYSGMPQPSVNMFKPVIMCHPRGRRISCILLSGILKCRHPTQSTVTKQSQ